MPKVNYITTKAIRKADALNQVAKEVPTFLRGANVNATDLGEKWSKSSGTANNRLKNPENLTLAELIEISTIYGLHCTIEFQNGSTTTKINW